MTVKQVSWSGVFLTCATYVYFLIYAQFAFLDRLTEVFPDRSPDPVLAGMGGAGLLGALLTGRLLRTLTPTRCLFWSLAGCALAALLTPFATGLPAFVLIAIVMGYALGTETVALATLLPNMCGGTHFGRWIGAGTGLAYFICNLPPLFAASATVRSLAAAGFALAGVGLVAVLPKWVEDRVPEPETAGLSVIDFRPLGFILILLCFTALIWLDSALFYIIQQTVEMKQVTWAGTAQKWLNGGIHLIAALMAGYALDKGYFSRLLPGAFAFLAAGSLLLLTGRAEAWAAPLYVAGVSLYSTVLVAFPGLWVQGRGTVPIRLRAAWIYAIGGWFGSAMGIGMARDLNRIPVSFLVLGGIAVLGVFLFRARGLRYGGIPAAAVLLLGGLLCVRCTSEAGPPPHEDAAARGRRVYLAEGCIHCHSQYVRPEPRDELMWGPHVAPEVLQNASPPLFGNRRQGPDLLNVGNRRGPIWQKQHLMDPRSLNAASTMPAYAYLFEDSRGEDLLTYLNGLGADTFAARLASRDGWKPEPGRDPIGLKQAATRFRLDCAPCHGGTGEGNGPLAAVFPVRPRNLVAEPFRFIREGDVALQLARAIKFGLPGTEMPGHETLSDEEVLGLVSYIKAIRKSDIPEPRP